MDCKFKKILLTDTNGIDIYVCTCDGSKYFGKSPDCEECENLRIEQLETQDVLENS